MFVVVMFILFAGILLWYHGIRSMAGVLAEPYLVVATMMGVIVGVGFATLAFARSELRIPKATDSFADGAELMRVLPGWNKA